MLSEWIESIGQWITYTLMPIVTAYNLITANIFLNTASEDATGLEKWGNTALAPVQYLLAGEVGIASSNPDGSYDFVQRFDYSNHLLIKTAGSIIAIPFSLIVGSALKGTAYCFSDVRERHQHLVESRFSLPPKLSPEWYRSFGIEVGDMENPDQLTSLGYQRHKGDEQILQKEKEALKEILELLKSQGILCWADSGTCLGAYRYGGVIPWDMDIDIAVLQPDFANVKRTLYSLPREKYLVEDWSNRDHPGTLLTVYVRETREYIDIYHFAVHPERKTIQFILSHIDNFFLPTSWKVREGAFTVETPFEIVFPLKTANFDGMTIPVPNDTEKYLQQRYGENLSPVKLYDEATQQYVKDPTHPYWQRAYTY